MRRDHVLVARWFVGTRARTICLRDDQSLFVPQKYVIATSLVPGK